MTDVYERQVIAQPLATYANANSLPVEWPNRPFNKPAEGITWVRFTVLDVSSVQIEMGSPASNTNRTFGSLVIQIFTPAGSGDGAGLGLADTLGALYRQQKFNFPDDPPSGHVRMRNPVAKTIGRDGSYWQTNLIIPFHRDDIP